MRRLREESIRESVRFRMRVWKRLATNALVYAFYNMVVGGDIDGWYSF